MNYKPLLSLFGMCFWAVAGALYQAGRNDASLVFTVLGIFMWAVSEMGRNE